MIPSVLARQLQRGIEDYFRTTYPFANEPFKSSFDAFAAGGKGLYLEPFTAIRLPFRTATTMPDCFEAVRPKFLPYAHQERAWRRLVGEDGQSTVIATGTGSGKTECFLYPILEYCYQHRATRGVKALIIYPMNALASDQAGRVAKLIWDNPDLKGNVSVGLYVGGLDKGKGSPVMGPDTVITDRETMQNNPPDILLTNYKMLDYLLIRPDYTHIWKADAYVSPLKYVAVDEIHTFDGAQGTDLACLLRRLKTRLRIPQGSLCCIGTSATMGDAGEASRQGMLSYAQNVFGEPFDEGAVIGEDRLTVDEFLGGIEPEDDPVMSESQCIELERLVKANDVQGYLQAAIDGLMDSMRGSYASDDETRQRIGAALKSNTLFCDLIEAAGGSFFQPSEIVGRLVDRHAWLNDIERPETVIDALVALVSHARAEGSRPFLTVQTQLWTRELARLLGEVKGDETRFELAINLKQDERKHFLPLHNCRDCGQTAWISLIDHDMDLKPESLDAFYNSYFGSGEDIVSLYPRCIDDPRPESLRVGWLCPDCLHVTLENALGERERSHTCGVCDNECIPVFISEPTTSSRSGSGSAESRQYMCPHCGSPQGLSLMGLRNTTEAEVALSQMFASAFDDDNKSLAFSDNVQDASHRAGFFNGRTWRFGLRTAMAQWLGEDGDGMALDDFAQGFALHFMGAMPHEEYVARFLAPNNLWMRDYEHMLETGRLADNEGTRKLLESVQNRMRYEVVLEFGMRRHVGRTLEKSGVASIAYDEARVEMAIAEACELLRNEEGAAVSQEDVGSLVILFLDELRGAGAIADAVYDEYLAKGANGYYLSHRHKVFMPGWGAMSTPRFLLKRGSDKQFLNMSSNAMTRIVAKCLPRMLNPPTVIDCVARACARAGLLVELASETRYACYGIKENAMRVVGDVAQLECPLCGSRMQAAGANIDVRLGVPCLNGGCTGRMALREQQGPDYYGGLFTRSLSDRVRAAEHTGLLQRTEREELERQFKATAGDARPWYPNVLSCTPTLEMGIDIGDLSSLMLCGMPPGQAQFLQRVGRAGRRDGNAFCLVLADANARGMYFYAAPEEMLEGNVEPPRVFLHAAAVLARQLVAFCLDSWILQRGVANAIVPPHVRPCLLAVAPGKEDGSKFPYNFLSYVKANKRALLNTFLTMFRDDLADDEQTKEALRTFIMGGEDDPLSLPARLLEVFQDRRKLRESYQKQLEDLKKAIADLESKPADSSFETQLKERRYERRALIDVIKSIDNEDVYGLLSRESLLPNYAFPEDGVNLRTVVRRKEENTDGDDETRWERTTREYSRAAASAITDFAPSNTFYAGGRHFTIDQIDLSTSEEELWRLCPNCSHAERIVPATSASTCPKCGSPAWADAGQVHKMLKLKTVVSNVEDQESRTDDSSESRTRAFFNRQLLVEIDQNDVKPAYHLSNKATGLDFGFEYASVATLREVNFGRSREFVGRETYVAGKPAIRPGFRFCSKCGMLSHQDRRSGKEVIDHTYSCPVRSGDVHEEDAVEDSLFIYREFKSEALRVLIPETSLVAEGESIQETFVASVMLGMRKKFGNVDHIGATISDEPIPDGSGYRKLYLDLYDSVPGGTGYLKQLSSSKDAFMEVLDLAREALVSCTCAEDPDRDGCYHCLFAYRMTKNVGSLSRRRAIQVLNEVLDPDNEVVSVRTVSDIKPSNLLESELEKKFVDALSTIVGAPGEKARVVKELVNDKMGYELTIGHIVWDVEPQVSLGPTDGVSVPCKPDFVLWPKTRHATPAQWLPVAVFTDGFEYHKARVADDSVKREAIRRSGKYRVWGLSFADVEAALDKHTGDYYLDCLKIPELPSENVYSRYLAKMPSALVPSKLAPFGLLAWYLTHEEAEMCFAHQASAYGMGMLGVTTDRRVFDSDNATVSEVSYALFGEYTPLDYDKKSLLKGWSPSENEHLRVYAGASIEDMKKNSLSVVYAVLDDTEPDAKAFRRNWNGYLDLFNLMQFEEAFRAVTMRGLLDGEYAKLDAGPSTSIELGSAQKEQLEDDAWQEVINYLFGDTSKDFARRLATLGVTAPDIDDIGYDGYEGCGDAMAELAWPDSHVCYLTPDQEEDAAVFIENGWSIIKPDMTDAEIRSAFE